MLFGGLLLSITICLIPIVILVGLAFGIAILVGWLTLGYLLGTKISESLFHASWHSILSASVGNLVLYLVARGMNLIPCIGGPLVFIAILFGLGMVVVTLFGTNPYPRGSQNKDEEKVVLFQENNKKESEDEISESTAIIEQEPIIPEPPIEDLGLSNRVNTILKDAGLNTIQDVLDRLKMGDDSLLSLDGFGQKSLESLKDALRQMGYEIP
jgi:hypothetical protein